VPIPHEAQDVALKGVAYLPSMQVEQAAWPWGEKLPGEHAVHVDLPIPLKNPALQYWHVALPASENVPAGQTWQVDCLLSEKVPA